MRRETFEQRLYDRLPDLRIWRGLMLPASGGDAEGVLASAGDLLLQFVVDDEDLLVVGVRRSEQGLEFLAHVRATKRRTVAERVVGLVQPDVLRDEQRWRKAAADLLETIPAAVVTAIAASRQVVVVPHEFLWRVPFEAMPMGTGYLADTAGVRYAQSLSALVRVVPRQPAAVGENATLLVAFAPDLHESVRARLAQTAPGWALRTPESAALEAKALLSGNAHDGGVISLAGADLTEAGLRRHLASAGTVHLAAPFRINGSGAMFSRIVLAGALAEDVSSASSDPADDGSLDPREVMNLDLAARAIVLTDGTALTMRDAADDAATVHWAWRAAGVPALVMPRWAADAEASNDLLATFHSRLRKGEMPEEALIAAQRAMRRTDGRAAPYHWAGWLLFSVR
jgi:CHAT domain-containing protein